MVDRATGHSGPLFAEVALPFPVDRTFTYLVPDSLRQGVLPGMRALVPVKNRLETGYVVALSTTAAFPEIRELIDLPDSEPVFSSELLELCRWIADYYCCSWGEALHCAVPAGIHICTRLRYRLADAAPAGGRLTEQQRRVLEELRRSGPLTERQLAARVGRPALVNALQSLMKRGFIVAEPVVLDQGVSPRTETYVKLVEANVPGNDALAAFQRKAPRQAAVYLDLLHGEPERPAALLYEKHKVNLTVLRSLAQRGLITLEEREFYRLPEFDADLKASLKHDLNDEQRAAYEAVVATMERGQFQTFLIRGVTGSGKTEIYLQVIERALELNRDAILLVPEIALTPQTVGRFKARFDAAVAVLHSGLAPGERYDEWRRAQRGEVQIVVGARSAIFAPLPRIGVIVVDEEHDGSYKQTENPRYHARDVAILRAKMNKAVCILGSATPSIESYYNTETGKSVRLELTRRATNAALPEVELVDMRIETRELGGAVLLSRRLEAELKARVEAGDQALLLLNRRGFAPFVLCPLCGWVVYCKDCQVTMTYHAKGAFLSCHYCNARQQVPQACEPCGFSPLLFLGTGTQRIEDLLLRSFPKSRIERMDADTTSGRGGHAKILGRLAARDIDILVGTQMIAKGHDYPGVTLVGVINGDTSLALPDFRAAENAFQLLSQVAGRAGRGSPAQDGALSPFAARGKVIIQTYRPTHYSIQCAATHDYVGFYNREIQQREKAGYPPFRRMANLAIECPDPLLAERAAALVHRLIREQRQALQVQGIQTIGPAPATVRRVKKKYRWNIAMLSRSAKHVNALARAVHNAFHATPGMSGVDLKIDCDPYGVF